MKITGIQIREAVKHWTAQKLLLSKVFVDSGFSFPNENKQTPEEVAAQFEQASRCVAELESLQQAYNGAHSFVLEGRMLTLSEGVKLMAAYAQLVNMWTSYAQRGLLDIERPYNTSDGLRRAATDVVAVRRRTTEEANQMAAVYSKKASRLRNAVAVANTSAWDISDEKLPLFTCVTAEAG
ncbi:MAG: hypothetical protein RL277_2071 [Planctomycetota bacterium]|jgi:hypothetical protein